MPYRPQPLSGSVCMWASQSQPPSSHLAVSQSDRLERKLSPEGQLLYGGYLSKRGLTQGQPAITKGRVDLLPSFKKRHAKKLGSGAWFLGGRDSEFCISIIFYNRVKRIYVFTLVITIFISSSKRLLEQ